MDEPSIFFKIQNFIYVKIISYGFLAEILLFVSIIFLILSFAYIFLNSKYSFYIAKAKLSFLKEYFMLFLREKYRFVRSFLFEIHKFIKTGVGYRFAIFIFSGFIVILIIVGLFIYYLKTKYIP